MNRLIDVACPKCGRVIVDLWVMGLNPTSFPACSYCGVQVERALLSAPGITPRGTRPERNTDRPAREKAVDTKAIAAEAKFEVEQKWLRYSDEKVAEQHISREINEAAGIADAAGNEKPVPKPDPIMFAKPTPAECAG